MAVVAAFRSVFCSAAAALLLVQVVGAAEYAMRGYNRRRGTYKIPRITTTTTTTTEAPENPPMQVPLDIVMRLSEIENVTDFLEHFVDKNSVSEDDLITTRFGATERKAIQYAKQAVCKPELQTVELYPNDNPLEVPYPSCTRIERCGGCCGHSLLSCQPTDSEIVNFQVYIAEYRGGDLLQQQRKEVVPVERHLKCKCSCIVKEENCTSLQRYVPNECACVCRNTDEEDKCKNQQNIKLWDPHECTCKCRNTRECTTGFFFDPDSCSCQPSNRWQTPGAGLIW